MGVGGKCHGLVALPPEKAWYPLYRRLGGPQRWSGQVQKISPPLGLDPQPVASNYTSCAIPTHMDSWNK